MQESLPQLAGSRRWLAGTLTVLIVALVLIVACRRQAARQDGSPGIARAPVLGPHPITVAPGIYLLGGMAPAAAYVVETSEGLALIDTGLEQDAAVLKKQMAALNLNWKHICAIFLTHVHGDHTAGAQYLRTATGAKVYAGRGDAAILRAGGPREAFYSTYPVPLSMNPVPTTVDMELSGDEEVAVGDVTFRAIATPGHSPGSICYLMERGEQRALFTGDVIWALSTRGRPLGTAEAYLAPRYRGDAAAYLATLRRLRQMPAPPLVLPGHPRLDPAPQSPAMTQEHWEALLNAGIREMEQLEARYARDGANFLDGTPKRLLPDLYYLGEFKDVAVYGFLASKRFFVVNAPGKLGLSAFLSARLEQLGLKPTTPAAVLLTSGDPEETAGLAELVEKSHCQVVASASAWEKLKTAYPAGTIAVAPDDLTTKGWFGVTPIPLGGRGTGPVAYLIPWGGKSILFTGRIPIKVTPASWEKLLGDLAQGRDKVDEYRAALRRLSELKPALWLPAFPTDGQNANLYGNEWAKLLADNGRLPP
jgi:glyoxylase-like metal-dependent hydrolase (beta-lactamase superfamily II)